MSGMKFSKSDTSYPLIVKSAVV